MKRLYEEGYNYGGLKFKFATIGMKGDVVSRFKPHSMHGNAGELTLRRAWLAQGIILLRT